MVVTYSEKPSWMQRASLPRYKPFADENDNDGLPCHDTMDCLGLGPDEISQ